MPENAECLVFDTMLWNWRDVGDNSQFWQRAEIIRTYWRGRDHLADVRFFHDGRISTGHFVTAIRLTPQTPQGTLTDA